MPAKINTPSPCDWIGFLRHNAGSGLSWAGQTFSGYRQIGTSASVELVLARGKKSDSAGFPDQANKFPDGPI